MSKKSEAIPFPSTLMDEINMKAAELKQIYLSIIDSMPTHLMVSVTNKIQHIEDRLDVLWAEMRQMRALRDAKQKRSIRCLEQYNPDALPAAMR